MGSGLREVFGESVSAVTATAPADLSPGTIRYEDGERYLYVYNGGGQQILPGYAVRQSGSSGYTVTVTSTAALSIPIGVVKHSTLAVGSYGWVLKNGTGKFVAATNDSFAIGNGLVLGADGTFGNPAGYKTVATGSSGINNIGVCGVAQAAVDSAASGLGYFSFL
jgi:hypothetical protein